MAAISISRHPATTPLTCAEDGRSHQVSDEQMVVGRHAGNGRYVTLCGNTVTAMPLLAPDGPACAGCAVATTPSSRSARLGVLGRHRRPGLLRRLLGHPATVGPESSPASCGLTTSQPGARLRTGS